jgi:hypothetical protein
MSLSEAKRKLLQRYLQSSAASVPPITAFPARSAVQTPGEPATLSYAQEHMWRREISRPGIPLLYNECIVLRMPGQLDIRAFERSFLEIVRRHEIWRTSYEVQKGQLLQVVHPVEKDLHLPLLDLRGCPSTVRKEQAKSAMRELVQEPFDLQAGPLFKARLIRIEDFEHWLVVSAHLSVVDGVSVYQIFPSELAALYQAFSHNQPSPLSPLTLQFGDFARWQRSWFQESEFARQITYWRSHLSGALPNLAWPTDCPRPLRQTFRGAMRQFAFSRALSEAVQQMSQRVGVSLFTILTAGFATLLHRYSRQDEVILGTFSPSGRKRSEFAKLLGHFINPVPLRCHLTGEPSFCDLARRIQAVVSEAIANDDVPQDVLAREIELPSDPSRNPLFTVGISLQPPMPASDLGWTVTSMDVESGGAFWDLYMAFISRPGALRGRVQYNPDLFYPGTVTRMLDHLRRVLQRATVDPEQPISRIGSVVDEGERPSTDQEAQEEQCR